MPKVLVLVSADIESQIDCCYRQEAPMRIY
jgi:hypothetical protein